MGIKQLYNDNLRKLPKEYGDVSVMLAEFHLLLYCEYASISCTDKLIKYECWPIFLTPYLPKPHVHN